VSDIDEFMRHYGLLVTTPTMAVGTGFIEYNRQYGLLVTTPTMAVSTPALWIVGKGHS
jgi:hypothetical protein